MAVPKKNKVNIDVNPPKIGTDYLKYGMDRIEELMRKTDTNTQYLPKTTRLEDTDAALFEYVNNESLKAVIDGVKVPTFYLDNDRWGEFKKTWKFTDNDKNVPTPYITVRRSNKEPGTRIGNKSNVPQLRKFRYIDVPILDDGEVINLRFKMPEPVNVDLIYEVSLFTKYRVDVNQYDEQILKNFASKQDYIAVKGNPIPLIFEGFNENNTIENIDGDRFFMSTYTIRALTLIQNEDDFEIVKTTRQPKLGYSVR
ncbi:MAG: hypothetical protein ACOC2W_01505 [bacterium]